LLSPTFLLLGTTHFSLWISTAMMGISFSVVLLWRRESGPHGHGLESVRQAATAWVSHAGKYLPQIACRN
jgi:hypothetical protein